MANEDLIASIREIESTVETIFLGFVTEAHIHKPLVGVFTWKDRGYIDEDGDPSPCWVWSGPYKNGRPVVMTRYSNYSPRALLLHTLRGQRGVSYALCGHYDCVRPGHLVCMSYRELGRRGAAARWGKRPR